MSLQYIDEPYRTEIVEILSDNADSEILYQRLKVYLISEPYFKHFTSEPAWLTKEIIKDFKKGDENGEF